MYNLFYCYGNDKMTILQGDENLSSWLNAAMKLFTGEIEEKSKSWDSANLYL